MPVGARDGVNFLAMSIRHHLQKLRIDVRLSLEIKNQENQLFMQLIDGFAEKIGLQIARFPRKRPQSAGAFRAAQVAGRGGLDADRDRHSPLHGATGIF